MGTNRQFDKNSRSKTYKEINLFKKLNSQSQSSPRPLPPRIPSPTIPGSAQWPPTRPSDPATDRSTLASVATMTSSQLRPNTGKQGLTGKAKFDDRKYWTYGCHCLM